jgi:hypothetical protein
MVNFDNNPLCCSGRSFFPIVPFVTKRAPSQDKPKKSQRPRKTIIGFKKDFMNTHLLLLL